MAKKAIYIKGQNPEVDQGIESLIKLVSDAEDLMQKTIAKKKEAWQELEALLVKNVYLSAEFTKPSLRWEPELGVITFDDGKGSDSSETDFKEFLKALLK